MAEEISGHKAGGYVAAKVTAISRAEFEHNLAQKIKHTSFLSDLPPLLRPGVAYDAWRRIAWLQRNCWRGWPPGNRASCPETKTAGETPALPAHDSPVLTSRIEGRQFGLSVEVELFLNEVDTKRPLSLS